MSYRVTKKQLDEAAKTIGAYTGRTVVVKPFPAPGCNGYNLVEIKGGKEYVLKGGQPARSLLEYMDAYIEGYRVGRHSVNHAPDGMDEWAEDQTYSRSDWKHEVWNSHTNFGYWQWVEYQKSMAKMEAPEPSREDSLIA